VRFCENELKVSDMVGKMVLTPPKAPPRHPFKNLGKTLNVVVKNAF